MSGLLLWGAGGHGKVVLDVARASAAFRRIAFVDDAPGSGPSFCGCEILGTSRHLERLAVQGYSHFLASIGHNRTRAACFQRAVGCGFLPATLVHPSALVSPSARIGAGTVVMPRAVVNADAVIERNCIINTGAIVEHDCIIGDHVHVASGAVLGGAVKVDAFALVGAGAVLLPGVEIGEGATLGAGAVVLDNIPPDSTAVGVPARVLVTRIAARAIR